MPKDTQSFTKRPWKEHNPGTPKYKYWPDFLHKQLVEGLGYVPRGCSSFLSNFTQTCSELLLFAAFCRCTKNGCHFPEFKTPMANAAASCRPVPEAPAATTGTLSIEVAWQQNWDKCCPSAEFFLKWMPNALPYSVEIYWRTHIYTIHTIYFPPPPIKEKLSTFVNFEAKT